MGSLLEEIVEALCRHVSDDSPTVRRLCLKGLVQVYFFSVSLCVYISIMYNLTCALFFLVNSKFKYFKLPFLRFSLVICYLFEKSSIVFMHRFTRAHYLKLQPYEKVSSVGILTAIIKNDANELGETVKSFTTSSNLSISNI